jgi:uncharacterized protein (DUF342 family)
MMAKNKEPRRNNSNATTLNESSLELNKSMEEDEEQLDDDNELDQQAQQSSKVSAKKRMPTINQNVRVNNKNLYRMVLSLC